MTTEILMPKLGFAMNEGVIQEWILADGSPVQVGDPLFIVESDKSVTEIESPASGVLRIIVSSGQTCDVGTLIGSID
jgi:pyruvate/2-oxoglutarate dehydrogenase complex dihydrolipoamide acyltransferase (E2) component